MSRRRHIPLARPFLQMMTNALKTKPRVRGRTERRTEQRTKGTTLMISRRAGRMMISMTLRTASSKRSRRHRYPAHRRLLPPRKLRCPYHLYVTPCSHLPLPCANTQPCSPSQILMGWTLTISTTHSTPTYTRCSLPRSTKRPRYPLYPRTNRSSSQLEARLCGLSWLRRRPYHPRTGYDPGYEGYSSSPSAYQST